MTLLTTPAICCAGQGSHFRQLGTRHVHRDDRCHRCAVASGCVSKCLLALKAAPASPHRWSCRHPVASTAQPIDNKRPTNNSALGMAEHANRMLPCCGAYLFGRQCSGHVVNPVTDKHHGLGNVALEPGGKSTSVVVDVPRCESGVQSSRMQPTLTHLTQNQMGKLVLADTTSHVPTTRAQPQCDNSPGETNLS